MDRVWQLSKNVRVGVRAVSVHRVHGRGYARGPVLHEVTVRDVYLCVRVRAAEADLRPRCGDAAEPETAGGVVLPRRVLYSHAPRRIGGHRGAVEEAVRARRPGERSTGSHRLHRPPQLDHQPQVRALDARSADGVAVRLVDDYLPRGAEANPAGVLRGGKRGRREQGTAVLLHNHTLALAGDSV